MSDYKKQEKKEAEEALKRGLASVAAPYIKKAEKGLKKKAEVELKDLGLYPDKETAENIAKGAAVFKMIKDQKIKGKMSIDDTSSLEGELDFKNESIRLNYNKSF